MPVKPPTFQPPRKAKKEAPVPLVLNAPSVPPPTTIDEARAANPNLAPGAQLTAPLAAASGPIDVQPESLVVVVAKNFWQNATVVAIRNAALAAIGLALFSIAMQVVAANGDLSQVNWQTTQKVAIGTVSFSLASAYAAWWRRRDNNAVVQG